MTVSIPGGAGGLAADRATSRDAQAREQAPRTNTMRNAALGLVALLATPFVASSLLQSAAPATANEQSGSLLPSIGALKREYVRCARISSQRRLSMHGRDFCSAVGEQLLRREFGGDVDLLLAWWRTEQHVEP